GWGGGSVLWGPPPAARRGLPAQRPRLATTHPSSPQGVMTETTLSKKKPAFDSKLQSPTLFSPHVAAYPPGRVHRAVPPHQNRQFRIIARKDGERESRTRLALSRSTCGECPAQPCS